MINPSLLRTLGLVFLGLSLVVTGDVAGKMLTSAGANPFFVAWTRFGIAAILILPLSGVRLAEVKALRDWRVLFRALLIVGGICSMLTALRTEPIANVFGAFFIGPVVSYFLSALLLKEKISPARTILLLLGFAGVLLVVKPGFGATPGIAFALLGGCFHGTYLVATRWLTKEYRPIFLMVSQLLAGSIVLLPLGVAALPATIPVSMVWLVLISAIGSASGNYLLVIASRTTEASLMAPLIYTQLIAATAAGYLVFGDWPDAITLLGLLIIFASGLLSLWLARRVKQIRF